MAEIDLSEVMQIALKAGLVNPEQAAEVCDELGRKNGDPMPWLLTLEKRGLVTPLQSQKLLKGDRDGYFLGGYRILYRISSGSFGRVYRADDPQSGRVVAIKVLRRRWSEDKQRIELFEREGRVGMTMRHPNIVEILAVNRDPSTGQYYLVMEFVEGGNLREILLIRKKMELDEGLKILEDAAAGLTYAFSRGITHRDMKPSNILLATQGVAKLVDFGLAKLFSSDVREDKEEKVDRTVDYAGLEKATGVKSGDVRSDIFFLGCVGHEMLLGRSPLPTTANKLQRMERHRFENLEPFSAAEIGAPPSVTHLIQTMTAVNPSQRYQTPAQTLEAVRNVRREIAGRTGGGSSGATAASGPKAIFLVEKDVRLQDAIRDKLKEIGYKVFLAGDPSRALDRYRMQPYDGLIVDVGTVGEEGLFVFDKIMEQAKKQSLPCAGILVLSEEQADWTARLRSTENVAVLTRPVTLKKLHKKLSELLPLEAESGPSQEL